MSMFQRQSTALAATLAVTLGLGLVSIGRGQDPAQPADDALEKLLEKLEGPKEQPDAPAEKSKDGDKKADVRLGPKLKIPAPAEPSKDGDKKAGEVAPDDKDLDGLLERLGQTADAPTPDDPRRGGGPDSKKSEAPPTEGGENKSKGEKGKEQLGGEAKELDRHLEELTGRKPKRDKSDEQGGGEANGPLSKVIKEMRDVEQRLGKTDTGDETRRRQAEIVKNLESLIEQMRDSQSQAQAKKKMQLSMKPGDQPGSKPGQEKGASGKGVGASKPEKPTDKRALAGGKDEWGHLPPELREQMVNIFKEEGLPNKAEQIRRYYLSLSKKILTREE